MGKQWKQWQTLFWGAPKSLQMVTAAMNLKVLLLGRKDMTSLDSILKSRDFNFANKGLSSQGYGFSIGHIWMWVLGCKQNWSLKIWCFWTVVLEKTLESPLDCKEIQPVHPKVNQSWCSLEGLMLKLKLQFLATWCEELTHWKRPWCWGRLRAGGEGGDRGWDGWLASLTQWTWVWASSGRWEAQGSLVCCCSCGRRESDTTEQLNNNLIKGCQMFSWNKYFPVENANVIKRC